MSVANCLFSRSSWFTISLFRVLLLLISLSSFCADFKESSNMFFCDSISLLWSRWLEAETSWACSSSACFWSELISLPFEASCSSVSDICRSYSYLILSFSSKAHFSLSSKPCSSSLTFWKLHRFCAEMNSKRAFSCCSMRLVISSSLISYCDLRL